VSTEKLEKVRGGFADRVIALRRAKGWGQEDLAARLDVSNGTVGFWEIGKNKAKGENLTKLAALLEVTTDYLLYGTESAAKQSPAWHEPPPGYAVDDLLAAVDRASEEMASVKRLAEKLKPISSPRALPGTSRSRSDPDSASAPSGSSKTKPATPTPGAGPVPGAPAPAEPAPPALQSRLKTSEASDQSAFSTFGKRKSFRKNK
jgi:transcriptional regulator with XRE-family HTH domain